MFWRRKPQRTLVDVLREAIDRPDPSCGPPVDYMALLFRFSDVQQQPERKPTRPMVVPVILGISSTEDGRGSR